MSKGRPVNFIHIPKNAGSSIKEYSKKVTESKIIYHGHDAAVSSLDNQMIIIRDPYSRFCSAVQYAIEKFGHSTKIRRIIEAGLVTPNHWAEAWADELHPHHKLILDEVTNVEHHVDSIKIPYKWTYAPQSHWINEEKLRYVVPFGDIDSYVLYHFGKKISKKNSSRSQAICELSPRAKAFLDVFYKEDFEFIDKYEHFQISTWYRF